MVKVLNRFESSRLRAPGGGEQLTKQSFKEQCDVNVIVSKWKKSGVLPPVNARTPLYGDFTKAVDFQEAFERVRSAEEHFARLPAAVRRRCDHDPARFIEFVTDPENAAELRDLGLALSQDEEHDRRKEVVKVPEGEAPLSPSGQAPEAQESDQLPIT